jgi:hypothetical protein
MREVALDFVDRAARADRLFNGELFCVLRMSTSASSDFDEHPNITTSFYKTDYYTNQVIHRVFLKCKHIPALQKIIDSGRITEEVRFFLNGYGLNCLVCAVPPVDSYPIRQRHPWLRRIHFRNLSSPSRSVKSTRNLPEAAGILIFGRRGTRVSINDATGSWHVTANEALSKTDVIDQRVNIVNWVARALHEEVSINQSEILRSVIFNETIHLGDMQPGLLMVAFCEVDINGFKSRISGAQDARMEYEDYTFLPFSNLAIERALADNGLRDAAGIKHRFSASAERLLHNILARGVELFTI